jgi:hypothetical protein
MPTVRCPRIAQQWTIRNLNLYIKGMKLREPYFFVFACNAPEGWRPNR